MKEKTPSYFITPCFHHQIDFKAQSIQKKENMMVYCLFKRHWHIIKINSTQLTGFDWNSSYVNEFTKYSNIDRSINNIKDKFAIGYEDRMHDEGNNLSSEGNQDKDAQCNSIKEGEGYWIEPKNCGNQRIQYSCYYRSSNILGCSNIGNGSLIW